MNENFSEIKALFESFIENAAKQIEKGNKSAGQKARKTSLEIAKKLAEFRKISIEEAKNVKKD